MKICEKPTFLPYRIKSDYLIKNNFIGDNNNLTS